MKKLTFSLFLFITSFSLSLYAQNNHLIKGFVVDTAYSAKLANSSISVLNQKDSTLVDFTFVQENGSFSLNNLPSGQFILLVTYPGYADYVENFKLDSLNKEKDFGKLSLTLMAKLLQDVIIRGKATAIKIKGDTTEFNASSYVIQPNSKVEDLLKQLPGIQIDKDGKITAQGQTVNKVLVDGEEFFGDDPTLVTKNIRGDMVDKVQLYDKKSDQAALTGIDDGKKNQTINIILKEDKKQGYFGKVDIGGGTNKNYEAQAMFNLFKGKKKFSVYGTQGNTGRTGLGWEDNSKYGSSGDVELSDDGSMTYFGSDGDDGFDSFGGRYTGEGIPLSRSGGLHYDNKWNKDKESINANYKIGSLGVDGTKEIFSQNNLPGGLNNTISNEFFNNYAFRQKMDARYELRLDSLSSIRISAEGTLKNSEKDSHYKGSTSKENDLLLNQSDRNLNNKNNEKSFRATVFWNKKFRKKGRSVSWSLTENISDTESKGFLNSINKFYNDQGQPDSTKKVDQYKTTQFRSNVFNSNITYSEPLTSDLSAIFNYGLGINNSSQNRNSFNPSSSGQYTLLDSAFSNQYKFDQLSNQAGLFFNYNKQKTVLNFGTKVTAVQFDQFDEYKSQKLHRNFINWGPQLSYQYKFSQQKSLRFNYYGNTTQPNIDQIQPVRVNTDPLNITMGNPNLKPSFYNQLSLNYNSYKVLSSTMLWMNASYSFTMNPIVSNTVTDSVGKSTYQSINLSNRNSSGYTLFGTIRSKISSSDINLGFSAEVNGNTAYNYTNNQLNKTTTGGYSLMVNLSKFKQKKYSFYMNAGPSYNQGESSLQKNLNNNGWGAKCSSSLTVFLPWKIELASDEDYEFRGKTASFDRNFSRLTWNASVTKKFFKEENLRLTLSGRDLLNQNSGFERNAYGNMITQTNYSTVRRYFLCSLTWDFNKMGGSKTQP